jgi:hypothetical protein
MTPHPPAGPGGPVAPAGPEAVLEHVEDGADVIVPLANGKPVSGSDSSLCQVGVSGRVDLFLGGLKRPLGGGA